VATIKLNSLSDQPTKSNKGYKYNDLHLDFTPVVYNPPYGGYTQNNELLRGHEIVDIPADYDLGAIKNSLTNLFTTIPGQKILNPFFGLNLTQFIFEKCDEDTANLIGNEIVNGISTFEPRVSLQQVSVIAQPDAQQYTIIISFTVPTIGPTSYQFFGTLSNSGFVFTS
jgi:phage baseplate assembly protein W